MIYCRCRLAHEHAHAALHADQAVGLELLVGFGDGQRIGALLGGKGAHRRQHLAFSIAAVDDRRGDLVAQAQVNGTIVGHW